MKRCEYKAGHEWDGSCPILCYRWDEHDRDWEGAGVCVVDWCATRAEAEREARAYQAHADEFEAIFEAIYRCVRAGV